MSYKHDRLRVKREFQHLMRRFASVFYYGCDVDQWLPEIMLIPFITLGWEQLPVWCRVIAPPGSGKSAHLSLLEGYGKTFMLDEFTTKCFVSGYRGQNEDPSKLPQMDNKVLVITDESTLMQQRAEDRNLIQAILRKSYDGNYARALGNIKEVVRHEANFNMLMASTPIIDSYYHYNQALGERTLNYRLQIPNRKELTRRSIYNQKHSYKQQHTQLKHATQRFLRRFPKTTINSVKLSHKMEDMFVECADFVALVRTHVSRDATGRQITTLPQAEVASRLVQLMIQLAVADAALHGDDHVDTLHADKAIYIALCSMPTITAYLLYKMLEQNLSGVKEFTVQSMILETGIGRQTISHHIEDLAIHKVLSMTQGHKQGGRSINYTLKAKTIQTIVSTRLFQHYMPMGSKQRKAKRKDRYTR